MPTVNPDGALAAALAAGRWVASQPRGDVGTDLYAGSAGVALFLRRLAKLTGESWAADAAAEAGASLLEVATAAAGRPTGLYSGLSGVAFALSEEPGSTGAAHALIDEVVARPLSPDDCTDIISGLAGSGLSLLWAGREMGRPDALDRAVAVGDHLLTRAEPAEPEKRGLLWRMRTTDEYVMPNFSHGTAGVAFCLARLAAESGEERFLAAAEAGARHLTAIADRIGPGTAVHHHAPGGESLHYLGWCHGPPGTARLFQELATHTGDAAWAEARDSMAVALLAAGIPEGRTPGFWQNYGRCCGDAGVAEFAQDLLDAGTGPAADLQDLVARCTANVLRHAVESDTPLGPALSWPHCEHRNRPDEVRPAVGLMQGAAGIGLWLLRSAAARAGDPPPLRLPDDLHGTAVARSGP